MRRPFQTLCVPLEDRKLQLASPLQLSLEQHFLAAHGTAFLCGSSPAEVEEGGVGTQQCSQPSSAQSPRALQATHSDPLRAGGLSLQYPCLPTARVGYKERSWISAGVAALCHVPCVHVPLLGSGCAGLHLAWCVHPICNGTGSWSLGASSLCSAGSGLQQEEKGASIPGQVFSQIIPSFQQHCQRGWAAS